MEKIILKIKRKEGLLYSLLHDFYYLVKSINIPEFILPIYKILYWERSARISFFRKLITFFYLAPMFRSRCKYAGEGLNYIKLQQNFPYISGNINIILGSNVTVHSRSSFSAGKVFDNPLLTVGDNTYLGPGLSLSVAKKISIGSHCHIASNVTIMDNDGHPPDPFKRANHEPVAKCDVSPVLIKNNVWIGDGAIILKGVTIGEGAIVAAKSVVTCNIEQFTIVAGNPAKFLKKTCTAEETN